MILSTVCYIEKEGKYLMLHRTKKKKDINQDKWIGVGGKIEDKESPEECVEREVKEETGLVLKDYKLRCVITYVSKDWETEYMYVFTSDEFEGAVAECLEGDLQWIDKEKVIKLNIWEGDKIFLKKIQNGDPFFSIKLVYEGDKLLKYEIKDY